MNKVVLITGVSSGIGNATARLFSEEGWHVIGVSRTKTDKIEGVAHYIPADISNIADIERVFKEIEREEGKLDSLVNNAALQICKPILETTVEEWDKIFHTNVRSVFFCSKLAYPLMAEKGGSIVNVSSVHAVATSANIAAYAASKGAIKTLTTNLAIEFADHNIRVNSVLPGAIETPMLLDGLNRNNDILTDNSIQQKKLNHISERIPLKRIGYAKEIAQAIFFLSDCNTSSFITGQSIIVDGGTLIKLSNE